MGLLADDEVGDVAEVFRSGLEFPVCTDTSVRFIHPEAQKRGTDKLGLQHGGLGLVFATLNRAYLLSCDSTAPRCRTMTHVPGMAAGPRGGVTTPRSVRPISPVLTQDLLIASLSRAKRSSPTEGERRIGHRSFLSWM